MKLSIIDQSPIPAGSTAGDALANSVDLAQMADRLGYTRYWVAEHHAMRSLACTAPEILIARLGAATRHIRVGSGAVLLPYYAPMKVAESFRMLHALYPGRIDLGIGRAPGAGGIEIYALQRKPDPTLGSDFVQQVLELRAFLTRNFPEGHQYSQIHVSPDTSGAPDFWLLGSSPESAELAGRLGIPYAFAHFITQDYTRQSVEHYQRLMAELGGAPRTILSLGAVVADTHDEALRLLTSTQLQRRRNRRGIRGPVPTPEEAIAELGGIREPEVTGEWPRYFAGTPDEVRDGLEKIAGDLNVDELMIVTVVHDHQARKRSYELLAKAFDLKPPV